MLVTPSKISLLSPTFCTPLRKLASRVLRSFNAPKFMTRIRLLDTVGLNFLQMNRRMICLRKGLPQSRLLWLIRVALPKSLDHVKLQKHRVTALLVVKVIHLAGTVTSSQCLNMVCVTNRSTPSKAYTAGLARAIGHWLV